MSGVRRLRRALLLAAGMWCAIAAAAAATERPNIVFLFADDLRADAIAALGNPDVKTPHLDSLVRAGRVFTNAYCLGANMPAVCTPSRNTLLSGQSYFRWRGPLAPADRFNLPRALNERGYATYHHGKRGNTATAIQALFEVNKYVDDDRDRNSGEPGREIVDQAIETLRSRDESRPFCMYLAFSNPHDPRVAAPAYRELYRPDELSLPANFLPLHPFDNGELEIRDERLAPWPRTADEIRRQLHDYYAVISGLDHHLGRLLATLDELGMRENTVIVFSADHGLALGSHGLMGKQSLYDHSMKAPLVFAGPGIVAGKSDALVYLHDICPTLCELAGAALPERLDGQSLAPLLRGEQAPTRPTLFLAYRDVQRAVRDQRFKLIRYPQVDVTQLFDLANDPHELHNLASDPAYGGQVLELRRALSSWQESLGDNTPWVAEKLHSPVWTPPSR
ncbi:MAG: sulfatase-like hydrolase/transferase [Pirellulales bacterium]